MTHSFASPQNCNICHEDKIKYQQLFTARQDLYFVNSIWRAALSWSFQLYYSMRFSSTVVMSLYVINQWATSPLETGLDVMHSHPLRRTRLGEYQASSAVLRWREMGTVFSCTKCSQMAGLIQKFGRDSSKAPSLCAAVLHAAVFHLKIVRSDHNR